MNSAKEGDELGFHRLDSVRKCGTWFLWQFSLFSVNENPFFLILLKLKHWWVSGLESLIAIVKRHREYHFCVCPAGRSFEGSGSWLPKCYRCYLIMFTSTC